MTITHLLIIFTLLFQTYLMSFHLRHQPTLQPTPSPTPIPTPAPVGSTEEKYICAKNDPGDAEICSTGTPVGGDCTEEGANCGKGGKKCYLATCPGASGPTPPPTPEPPTPTPPSPPSPTPCPICGNGDTCCPELGACETSGSPSGRSCVPII